MNLLASGSDIPLCSLDCLDDSDHFTLFMFSIFQSFVEKKNPLNIVDISEVFACLSLSSYLWI